MNTFNLSENDVDSIFSANHFFSRCWALSFCNQVSYIFYGLFFADNDYDNRNSYAEATVKQKRIQNEALCEMMREHPCYTCYGWPTEAHHLTTRGAGGDDVEDNLISLCRECHTKIHQYGLSKFAEKHPRILSFLELHKRNDLLEKINNKGE